MAMDRLNRSRRDKLDWAAKLGLGPLAGGEALPGQGPVPGNAREAQTQRKQAEEMAELRRRIDEKQAEVAASKPPQPEEEVDASGFLNPNAKASGKKKVAPKSVLELRIGQKPTVVVTSRPDDEPPPGPADQEPEEEKDEKNLKAERRAKQKAATRFQDVEEEYSLDSQGRENRRGRKKKRRAGRCDEDSEEERRYRSRSGAGGRLSEDPYGRGRGDRSRSYDRYYDDDDDSSEIRRRKRQKEKRLREEWRKEWKKKKEMDKRRAGGRSSDEESEPCDLEKRADGSAERSPGRQLLSKKEIGVPEAQVDHVGGVQRKYVGQLRDSELDERLRRAELALYGGSRKLLTEAEAIALLQGGNKRRR
mmetsp:Transcript_40468/g.84411  ORF Transcript_40468/g.84411 Transcript_40468/m.84411 type:complete len:363 (-) Transcript_40468:87-1175(-)